MINENISVIPLAIKTGILWLNKPYRNHKSVPVAKSEYIDKEMLFVFLVLIVFNA